MQRRLEALGQTHDIATEASDTGVTDAATADPLAPAASPRVRAEGLNERNGTRLEGLLMSPAAATPASPRASAGASGGALATPSPMPILRSRASWPAAVQDAEFTEGESPSVVVTSEHRGDVCAKCVTPSMRGTSRASTWACHQP